jgi:hypothetical protein
MLFLFSGTPAICQQSPGLPATTPSDSTPAQRPSAGVADASRQERAKKNSESDQGTPATQQLPAKGRASLGELAEQERSKRQAEVKVTAEDMESLSTEINEIMEFASQDSGLARHSAVKHQLVSQDDVKHHTAAALNGLEETQRMERSEVVLKKFGYFPRDFNLKNFLVTASPQSLGGYYEFQTKTMNLVNWVGLEDQRPIMAHELTHALQDQNYDLMHWEHRSQRPPAMHVAADEAVETIARRAVVEGQAMIVYVDYLLKPYGRTLGDTPGAMEYVKDRLTASYDTTLVVRNAPLLLKETGIFPYREGLVFEMELLQKGGTSQAFAGAFAHPPSNTHEIMEPKAYLDGEKTPAVTLPDLTRLLADKYDVYDSGSMGQLDVRILAQQLGSENDMFTVTPSWNGGAYVAVKRRPAPGSKDSPVSTASIALLYVSRWKSASAARRFIEVYQTSLPKRVGVADAKPWVPAACAGKSPCPSLRATRVNTNEGPVFLELLPNNTVFIAHSFPEETANSLRQVVLSPGAYHSSESAGLELNVQLQEIPAFQAFQQRVGWEIRESLEELRWK